MIYVGKCIGGIMDGDNMAGDRQTHTATRYDSSMMQPQTQEYEHTTLWMSPSRNEGDLSVWVPRGRSKKETLELLIAHYRPPEREEIVKGASMDGDG